MLQWKKLSFKACSKITGLIVTASFPMALVACGESSDVEKANAEQQVINNLNHSNSVLFNEPLVAIKDQKFDMEVAKTYGFSNFNPKKDYVYTYSHDELKTDGNLSFSIIVKYKTTTSGAQVAKSHTLAVVGLDLVASAKALKAITSSTLSAAKFGFIHKTLMPLTTNLATELGFTAPTLAPGVSVSLEKALGSADIKYYLDKENQPSQEIVVTFQTFSGVTTQADVDAERAMLDAALTTLPKLQINYTLPSVSDANLTSMLATRLGLVGFVPKLGFSYTYSHQALDTDGSLTIAISVKANSLVATSAVSRTINLVGLDLAKLANTLRGITTTTKTRLEFLAISLPNDVLLDAALALQLGMTLPTIPSTIEVKAGKPANGANVAYTLTKADQNPMTIFVEFTNFA